MKEYKARKEKLDFDINFFRNLWTWYGDKTKADQIGEENAPELYNFFKMGKVFLAIKKGRKGYYLVGRNARKQLKEDFKNEEIPESTLQILEKYTEEMSLEKAKETFCEYLFVKMKIVL